MNFGTIYYDQGTHCTGKTGEFATTKIPVRENARNLEILPKTQGIWFAQVVHSLNLKVKDISIFAAKKIHILGGAG